MDRYARGVGDGSIVAGPLVRLACERHLRDRANATGLYVFDEAAADLVIAFFETVLRLPDTLDEDGEPIPFLLTPANTFIVGSLFGWKKRADGYRRFREGYIEQGKGNGKTPMLAGIGLFGLTTDGERAAEIYSAATGQEQAKIIWNDAKRMVECSELASQVAISQNNLAHPASMSFFRPMSNEKRGKSGPRPHMGLIDELHEAADSVVVNKVRAGAKRRKQPLFLEITNSGFDRTSICWQHHEHSRRVLEGTIEDDQWFGYVCALDDGDDPLEDPACHPKANPNLGIVIQQEYLDRQVKNAKNIPSETNDVLRYNFCVWTQAQSAGFDMVQWHACGELVIRPEELVGVPAFGAIDLGQTDDLSALAGLWRLPDGRALVRCRFWLPDGAMRKHPDRPYAQWQRQKLLTVVPGDVLSPMEIADDIDRQVIDWGLQEVGYDKRFAQDLARELEGRGHTMVDVPQGFFLNEAIRSIATKVAKHQLAHESHAILGWMAANTVILTGRRGDQRLDKVAAKDKIDGIVALVMAESRAIVNGNDNGEASRDFEDRGLFL